MNLNISYNWLKEYVRTDLSPQEFAKRISLVGPSVDHITEMKSNFSKVVVGLIMKIENHPDADKLHVCRVNVGKEELQIVCGAPNIKVGQKVPVVLIGGKVGDFDIKTAKLRGVESFGMLCSQKELGLGEDHSGIFILPSDAKIGEPLEKIMPLNDFILDVEVTSNRPDAMSVVGLAREAAAAIGAKNLWKQSKPDLKVKGDRIKLTVTVKDSKTCPRYQAVVMTGVKSVSSPLWLQQRLISAGHRPINNLVDITNYILMEYGQPMHVFDYDKLNGAEIIVREAKKGEKILALDGKEYELSAGQLVIADKKSPVAVAGVMGGELSAATAETKTIVFECASFDSVSVRKTSRALNLRSDSSNLYEKGISPENTSAALLRAIELAQEIAGAKVASAIIDQKSYKHKDKTIKLSIDKVSKLLGVEISAAEIKKSLSALGFGVKSKLKGALTVTIPWWRDSDILGEHDLVEEVARMHGYFNLPTQIMATALPVNYQPADDEFYWEDKIKDILAGFGLTEIYTYSFISEKTIVNAGLKPVDHIKIANPLSTDFEYMRTSLVPGALQTIAENQGLFSEGKIFDLSKVYIPQGEHELADEKYQLLIAVFSNDLDAAFNDAKGIMEGLKIRQNISDSSCGQIEILNNKIKVAFGLKKDVVLVSFDFSELCSKAKTAPEYMPIPKFPSIDLDLSMEIDSSIQFADVSKVTKKSRADLIESVEFLSAYQGSKIAAGRKALAIRIIYRDKNKTLELKDAQAAHEKVVASLKKEYNIVVR